MMRRAALVAAGLVLAAGLAAAAEAPVTRLARPSFPPPASEPALGAVRLSQVSATPNRITDDAAWVARNRLDLREYRVPGAYRFVKLPRLPAPIARTFEGLRLVRAIRQERTFLLVYGRDFASGRILVATDRSGRVRYALDFDSYARAPRGGEYQQIDWAVETAGTLYVAHSHSSTAAGSNNRNAYVTAINLASKKVRWRSPALVANAARFDVYGNFIVAGYGYSGEADFVYLIDRRTGKLVDREPTPTAPEYIVRKGSLLYVRTYDHDVVLKLARSS